MPTLKADRRLYVNADRSLIVEEGDPRGAWLLVGEGRAIGDSDVAKYGLRIEAGKIVIGGVKMVPKPEDKMVVKPEDKAVSKPEDKPAPKPKGKPLGELSKGDLEKLAADRGLKVKGSGKGGAVLKSDLLHALVDE